jgi:transposase-like protein
LPHCARTQEATAAVAQDAQVHGISTRSVGDLVRALGMTGISTSRVSRLCEEIDEWVSPLLLPRTSGPDWHAAKALR